MLIDNKKPEHEDLPDSVVGLVLLKRGTAIIKDVDPEGVPFEAEIPSGSIETIEPEYLKWFALNCSDEEIEVLGHAENMDLIERIRVGELSEIVAEKPELTYWPSHFKWMADNLKNHQIKAMGCEGHLPVIQRMRDGEFATIAAVEPD